MKVAALNRFDAQSRSAKAVLASIPSRFDRGPQKALVKEF